MPDNPKGDPNIPYGPSQKPWGTQVPKGADVTAPVENPVTVYPVVPPPSSSGGAAMARDPSQHPETVQRPSQAGAPLPGHESGKQGRLANPLASRGRALRPGTHLLRPAH